MLSFADLGLGEVPPGKIDVTQNVTPVKFEDYYLMNNIVVKRTVRKLIEKTSYWEFYIWLRIFRGSNFGTEKNGMLCVNRAWKKLKSTGVMVTLLELTQKIPSTF